MATGELTSFNYTDGRGSNVRVVETISVSERWQELILTFLIGRLLSNLLGEHGGNSQQSQDKENLQVNRNDTTYYSWIMIWQRCIQTNISERFFSDLIETLYKRYNFVSSKLINNYEMKFYPTNFSSFVDTNANIYSEIYLLPWIPLRREFYCSRLGTVVQICTKRSVYILARRL